MDSVAKYQLRFRCVNAEVMIVFVAAFGGTLGVHQVAAQQAESVWDGVYTEQQAKRGEPLFAKECAVCHGVDLEGGEATPALRGGEFIWRWNGLSIGDLFERIRVSMPQDDPRRVSRRDKADILAFLLLENGFPLGERQLGYRSEMLRQIKFLAAKPLRPARRH